MDLENFQNLLQHPLVAHVKDKSMSQLAMQLTFIRSAYVDPYVIDPLSSFLASTTGSVDIFSVLILVAILYISLRILDYARRVIMFWVFLALRLVFGNASRDLGWAWGVVEGFVEDFQARSAAGSGRPGASSYGNIPTWSSGKKGKRHGSWR
ncbi:hypothetical protein N7532_005815 [Penicillium argentinense]|uniref:Uncharacterized protein n=1 Tax=Penicillium argentinense TaxID=1131581 RepID=A0A9W9FEQ8_9EURO|nr:uncharacterized protein N7532_005815 [Penicillium argentinense]KAJ5098814.1 hypothetical protein N7532_005815 [Penicillium argentinense]